MRVRFGLAMLVLTLLAGCGTMHCAENSENSHVDGGCGVLQKF
jgi:hypothetical protein